MPDITFDCHGQIDKWGTMVMLEDEQPHIMHFQIWRPKGIRRFEMITSVPIDTPSDNSDITTCHYLTEEDDSSTHIQFEPGDVFGFFLPKASGKTLAFQQCYSTDFTSVPSNTIYYTNVGGSHPPCVMSLCDPATKNLSGVQLQINVSIGQESRQ